MIPGLDFEPSKKFPDQAARLQSEANVDEKKHPLEAPQAIYPEGGL
jgi:hypothetical protein